ncbi:hypothetical protein GTO82_04445 [Lactobacillus johnsonii]|uniref:Uncharacterized protein n=1 Tax=Lactobacillus johnsonii TaxID=33959 RepID=A0A9X7TWB3_LACJH|nr:hypothetical protein [Lactobacillus johnsonii]QLL68137.1 hypothetical protein GTO82_04445 [Lactobacillus johnsonii]
MKNKIKYILAAIISIVGIGILIFVSYLQIQDHASTRSIIWSIIEIILLLSAAFYYFRSAIKNTSDDKHNEEDSKLKIIETNSKAKAKSLDFISNLSFWCGMLLMIYASHQLKDAPQFSYILFAISGTLTIIWLITLVTQLFYIVKYGRKLDDTEK